MIKSMRLPQAVALLCEKRGGRPYNWRTMGPKLERLHFYKDKEANKLTTKIYLC